MLAIEAAIRSLLPLYSSLPTASRTEQLSKAHYRC